MKRDEEGSDNPAATSYRKSHMAVKASTGGQLSMEQQLKLVACRRRPTPVPEESNKHTLAPD